MDWVAAFIVLAWIGSGAVGGHMLSYPGDGLNMRHFFGAVVGPIALGLAIFERGRP